MTCLEALYLTDMSTHMVIIILKLNSGLQAFMYFTCNCPLRPNCYNVIGLHINLILMRRSA
jgi:hypothetical protein